MTKDSTAETARQSGDRGSQRDRHPVTLLRASLRAADAGGESGETRRRAADAAQPLIDSLYRMLLSYCDHLIRQSALQYRLDGVDLAHDTWVKVLRYLSGEGGDRIQDESHLRNLLRVSAKRRLLDLLEQEREARRMEYTVPESWEDPDGMYGTALEQYEDDGAARALDAIAGVLGDGPYRELVVALFTDEAAFRKACARPGLPRPRRLKHYRAFVTAQMGALLRREARRERGSPASGTMDEGYARLMREFALVLGVPLSVWEQVEETARRAPPTQTGEDGLSEEILTVVNREFDAELQTGNYLSVLKHELNRFAGRERKTPDKHKAIRHAVERAEPNQTRSMKTRG